MAVEVVAVVDGAEHRSAEATEGKHMIVGQDLLLAGDGVTDDEAVGKYGMDQHATVAAVEKERVVALDVGQVDRRGRGSGGIEARLHLCRRLWFVGRIAVLQEAQNRRCPVELAVAAEDIVGGDEGTPRPGNG